MKKKLLVGVLAVTLLASTMTGTASNTFAAENDMTNEGVTEMEMNMDEQAFAEEETTEPAAEDIVITAEGVGQMVNCAAPASTFNTAGTVGKFRGTYLSNGDLKLTWNEYEGATGYSIYANDDNIKSGVAGWADAFKLNKNHKSDLTRTTTTFTVPKSKLSGVKYITIHAHCKNGSSNKNSRVNIIYLDMSVANIAKPSAVTYTGNSIKPTPAVTTNYSYKKSLNGKTYSFNESHTLKKDTDYTLSYSNNVKPGTAYVYATNKKVSNGPNRKASTTFTINKKVVNSTVYTDIYKSGNYIYANADNDCLYRVNINTGKVKKITEGDINHFTVKGSYVYYLDGTGAAALYLRRVKTDGTGDKLLSLYVDKYYVSDSYVYYCYHKGCCSTSHQDKRMKRNGDSKTTTYTTVNMTRKTTNDSSCRLYDAGNSIYLSTPYGNFYLGRY